MKLDEVFEAFQGLHVLVVGDVMIDRYHFGSVDRISPEAPVPVVNVNKSEDRLGGAANVALNCRALGAEVTLATVIGEDEDAAILASLLASHQISGTLVQQSKKRVTTSKTRVLSRNQQLLRFDRESDLELDLQDEHAFIDLVLRFMQIHKPQVLIFEDYNKGVLKENVIKKLISHARHLGMTISVDPKKDNFFSFENVDIFKPNLKEVRDGLQIPIVGLDLETLGSVHDLLQQKLHHRISLITLSEHGIFFKENENAELLPSHRRNIADVSGAGDTVIAVATLVYAVTKNPEAMAAYSNVAGGLVCEEVGVVPVDREKLLSELRRLGH